jgi:anti-sigma regulatory factor (Ser/Thr protein kinase)
MPGNHPEPGFGTGAAFHRASTLRFAPLPTAIACARLHAVNMLYEGGLRDMADDAALIVSELMTNALNASVVLADRPPIALGLRASRERLIIEAWDHSRLDATPASADSDEENGRGLAIVAALSKRWGSQHFAHNLKVIWAEVEIPGGR